MPAPHRRRRPALACSFFFPWFLFQPSFPLPEETEPLVLPGVVIEEIPKGSALERAGLQVGDVITAWERLPNLPSNPEGASGVIETPFDWMWLEIEQAPRGVVRLSGRRQSEPLALVTPTGGWETSPGILTQLPSCSRMRPSLAGPVGNSTNEGSSPDHLLCSLLDQLRRIDHALTSHDSGRANEQFAGLDLSLLSSNRQAAVALHLVKGAIRSVDPATARHFLACLLGPDPLGGHSSLLTADLLSQLGILTRLAGSLSEAEAYSLSALRILEREAPSSLLTVAALNNLGATRFQLGRVASGAESMRHAKEILIAIHPLSPHLATLESNLGNAAYSSGDLTAAIAHYRTAIELAEKIGLSQQPKVLALSNLALTYLELGNAKEASQYYMEALSLARGPANSPQVLPRLLGGLGSIARVRGDLDLAERYFGEALSISRNLPSAWDSLSAQLTNLAALDIERGNYEQARIYLENALEAVPEGARRSNTVKGIYENMAIVFREQGDFGRSLDWHLRALDLCTAGGLISDTCADIWNNLGVLRDQQGDIAGARAYFSEALKRVRLEPSGKRDALKARILSNIGHNYVQQHSLRQAVKYFRMSLSLAERVAPDGEDVSYLLGLLGQIELENGHLKEAEQYLRRAVEVAERQHDSFSSTAETKLLYSGRIAWRYTDLIRVLVRQGFSEEAFAFSERGRARVFREQLSARGSRPAESSEQSLIEDSPDTQGGRSLDGSEMRREDSGLSVGPRRDVTRGGDAGWAQAVAGKEARRSEEALVIASFVVGNGRDGGLVFVRNPEGRMLGVLELRTPNLGQRIEQLRRQIATRFSTPGPPIGDSAIKSLQVQLYRDLIAPIEALVGGLPRFLIIPDGPLHYLPWGALIREYEENGVKKQQYLAEWKPFHIALSATVFAELKKQRRPIVRDESAFEGPPVPELVAFGDPVFPAALDVGNPESIADFRVRSAARRGWLDLDPLPWSRREVEGIAALFPPGRAKVFTGTAATEEEAKGVAKGARILHFATHARVDDRFPMNSALALTMPVGFPEDRENGLLQVWEIFENVRLDADLVVLSACETALGQEQGGEGLIGLTRAFQYAGARSVLASLWAVQDQATSELMIRFYKHLLSGLSKDEALRHAQMELIQGPIEVVNEKGEPEMRDYSAPYYWAGFQVYGDWQ